VFAGFPHSRVSLWCSRKPGHEEKNSHFFLLYLGNISIFPDDIINKAAIETKGQSFFFFLFSRICYSLFAGIRNYQKLNGTIRNHLNLSDKSARNSFLVSPEFLYFGCLWLPGVGEEAFFSGFS